MRRTSCLKSVELCHQTKSRSNPFSKTYIESRRKTATGRAIAMIVSYIIGNSRSCIQKPVIPKRVSYNPALVISRLCMFLSSINSIAFYNFLRFYYSYQRQQTNNQQNIIHSLKAHGKDKMIIVVSHRKQVIDVCDKKYVLNFL